MAIQTRAQKRKLAERVGKTPNQTTRTSGSDCGRPTNASATPHEVGGGASEQCSSNHQRKRVCSQTHKNTTNIMDKGHLLPNPYCMLPLLPSTPDANARKATEHLCVVYGMYKNDKHHTMKLIPDALLHLYTAYPSAPGMHKYPLKGNLWNLFSLDFLLKNRAKTLGVNPKSTHIDFAFMRCGMGFSVICSWHLPTQQCFYRLDGGPNGYEVDLYNKFARTTIQPARTQLFSMDKWVKRALTTYSCEEMNLFQEAVIPE